MADIINIDPHAGNQDPQPYEGEIQEYTTPGEEVKGKIDRLINIVKPEYVSAHHGENGWDINFDNGTKYKTGLDGTLNLEVNGDYIIVTIEVTATDIWLGTRTYTFDSNGNLIDDNFTPSH